MTEYDVETWLHLEPKFMSLQMGALLGAVQASGACDIPQGFYDAVRGLADESNQ